MIKSNQSSINERKKVRGRGGKKRCFLHQTRTDPLLVFCTLSPFLLKSYCKKHLVSQLSIFPLLILFVCTAATPEATAGKKESFPDAQIKVTAMVEAAHTYVRGHLDNMAAVQASLQNDPEFIDHDRNLYIFIHSYNIEMEEAICLGHGMRPELIGKNMWGLRTPHGRLLFKEISRMIETDGEGWLEYDWLNPHTQALQTKRSFIKGIILKDGRKAWVGCGFWKDG